MTLACERDGDLQVLRRIARDELAPRVAVIAAHDEDRRDDAGLAKLDGLLAKYE